MSSILHENTYQSQPSTAGEMVRLYTRAELEERIKREREKIWEEIARGHFEIEDKDWEIKFFLNWDLAQCKSKTELALCTVALLHYQNQQKYKHSKTPVKLLSVVFTNNSL